MGEAILTVGGTAKTLSGGVVEMNTALGILADNGIKGSEGGTMLRNVILSLSAPTSTAAAALSELGVTAFDASGAMRPLQETFADLDAALSTMSDQQKTAVLNEIFNKVDLKGVNALLGTSAERFDELSGYISNCAGAAAQMAETMDDNLTGDLTIMQSALEGLGIAAYEKFQEPFREAVQEVTGYIGDLTASMTDGELSGSVEKISEGFSELAATAIEFVGNDAIPAVISGLELIVDHAEELKFILILVAAEFIAFKAAAILTPVVGGIMAASRAVTLFAAEMSFANLQQLALRGGMTASEIVVGLFTGKITAATAAQAAFNAVSAAVPFGVLLAGLAAVVAATISFSNYISNAADEINDMRIADSVDIIIEKTNNATEGKTAVIGLVAKNSSTGKTYTYGTTTGNGVVVQIENGLVNENTANAVWSRIQGYEYTAWSCEKADITTRHFNFCGPMILNMDKSYHPRSVDLSVDSTGIYFSGGCPAYDDWNYRSKLEREKIGIGKTVGNTSVAESGRINFINLN